MRQKIKLMVTPQFWGNTAFSVGNLLNVLLSTPASVSFLRPCLPLKTEGLPFLSSPITEALQLMLICMMFISCAEKEDKNESARQGLMLDIGFSDTLTVDQTEELQRRIEVYRFHFSGSFPEMAPMDIERKKYSQYVFKNIPYDERLQISLEALDINHHKVCSGKQMVHYISGKEGHIPMVLICS